MTLTITWVLWIILHTTNPNVEGFFVIDEFPDQAECFGIAKQLAEEGIPTDADVRITGATVTCIPVSTRIGPYDDADKPFFQLLPNKRNQRTTVG